jgi:hypothetical protein
MKTGALLALACISMSAFAFPLITESFVPVFSPAAAEAGKLKQADAGTTIRTAGTAASANSAAITREFQPGPGEQVVTGITALSSNPLLKRELLNYSREIFLKGLGFGNGVAAPHFALRIQCPCFVTFFSGRRVIACYGGFYPRKLNLAEEIEDTIRLALLHDARARSIDRKTALKADLQITFPGEPHAVTTYADIDPLREGLLVENDQNGITIVPGEAKTAAWAFREAMQRLGEKDSAHVRLFKFQAYTISSRIRK